MRVMRTATTGERTTENSIFAAGDCCCLEWPKRESDHWFQLRLWRQARAAGLYAAQCMTDSVDELGPGGAFDLFVHATQFFGYQVRLPRGYLNSVSARLPVNGPRDGCTAYETPHDNKTGGRGGDLHKCSHRNVQEYHHLKGKQNTLDVNPTALLRLFVQVTLLGRYNGQGLGASIQDVVTRHAVDTLNSDSTPPQCHHESIHIKNGSSNIQVSIRTTSGSEYIKVSWRSGLVPLFA